MSNGLDPGSYYGLEDRGNLGTATSGTGFPGSDNGLKGVTTLSDTLLHSEHAASHGEYLGSEDGPGVEGQQPSMQNKYRPAEKGRKTPWLSLLLAGVVMALGLAAFEGGRRLMQGTAKKPKVLPLDQESMRNYNREADIAIADFETQWATRCSREDLRIEHFARHANPTIRDGNDLYLMFRRHSEGLALIESPGVSGSLDQKRQHALLLKFHTAVFSAAASRLVSMETRVHFQANQPTVTELAQQAPELLRLASTGEHQSTVSLEEFLDRVGRGGILSGQAKKAKGRMITKELAEALVTAVITMEIENEGNIRARQAFNRFLDYVGRAAPQKETAARGGETFLLWPSDKEFPSEQFRNLFYRVEEVDELSQRYVDRGHIAENWSNEGIARLLSQMKESFISTRVNRSHIKREFLEEWRAGGGLEDNDILTVAVNLL